MKTLPDKYRGTKEYHVIYSELITAARYRGMITYQEIAKIIGLPLSGNYMGAEIGKLIGEISEDEHIAGRPMLSAIIVGTSGRPGPGFFELARLLGKLESVDRSKEMRFWENEKKAAYEQWKVRLKDQNM